MKKENILYIGIAAIIGLLVGYFIFGGGPETMVTEEHDHGSENVSQQMWTCSMHPQIMQPEPGNCPICGMELIPADATTDGLNVSQIKMTENAMVLAGVETVTVGTDTGAKSQVKLSGKIMVNQEADAAQSAYFDGRIEKLFINYEGEKIGKGQKLATIYAPALVSAQQELLTASNLKSSQPQLYKAVRNKLKLWKLSDAQIDQIESSGKVVENFPVYSNVNGVVSKIMVEEGDYVKTGSPLVKVANLNSVWAVFDGYENQVALLKNGQTITVTTNAYPNEKFNATVSFIDPLLNDAKRTVEVRADLDNKMGKLKPGMFVQGEIDVASNSKKGILTIPESTVLWTGERSVVYVKPNPDNAIFQMREVELGNLMNGVYEIKAGLEPGEEVVAKGTFTVDAAAQLQGKKSMMNQNIAMAVMGQDGQTGNQMHMEFSSEARKQFRGLLETYLKLKDALVASDQKSAQEYAKKGETQGKAILDLNMDDMGRKHLTKIVEQLQKISNEPNLEQQRKLFIILSENMILVGNQMGSMGEKIYVQHCPMANDNNGANWLSLDQEIKNPYYGDAMLTCGSTVHVIE